MTKEYRQKVYIWMWFLLTCVTFAAFYASLDYRIGVVWAWGGALLLTFFLPQWVVIPGDRVWLTRALLVRLGVVLIAGVWVEGYYRLRTGLDADMYHEVGQYVANYLRIHKEFPYVPANLRWDGTIHYILMTGVVYRLFGTSAQMMKVLNTFVSFGGTIAFYHLYRKIYPERRMDLPLAFLLFMPSTLYWTTLHGKDPWMYAFLAMSTFFGVRFIEKFTLWDFGGFVVGVVGMIWLRPHVAGIFVASLLMLVLVHPYRLGALTPFLRIATLLLFGGIVALTILAVTQAFGIRNLNEAIQFVVERGELSAFGGSSIRTPEIHSFSQWLLYEPIGFVTVMFRPFLWEANSPMGIVSALENLILLFFSGLYLRKRRLYPTHPIGVMAGTFVLLFTYVFYPAVGNLGTLVRQKIQVLPFWFLYLGSLPHKTGKNSHVRD